jgi:hypothetical protein
LGQRRRHRIAMVAQTIIRRPIRQTSVALLSARRPSRMDARYMANGVQLLTHIRTKYGNENNKISLLRSYREFDAANALALVSRRFGQPAKTSDPGTPNRLFIPMELRLFTIGAWLPDFPAIKVAF